MPAKLSEKIRPTVIAGLAKLVELVKKYAAPMYAPTAAGARCDRPVRARAKITRTRPTVATTSESQWAPVALCFVEMDSAASENIVLARIAPQMHPPV